MFPPLVHPDHLAILQKAIDAALRMAARLKVDITVNEMAARMSAAYEAGERDPMKLADAVFAKQPEPALS